MTIESAQQTRPTWLMYLAPWVISERVTHYCIRFTHLFFNRIQMTQKSIQQTQLSVKNVCQLIQNKVESDLKYTSQVSRTWIFTDLESSLKTSEWTFWSTLDDFHVIFLFRDNFNRMLLLGFLCLGKSYDMRYLCINETVMIKSTI